MTDIVKVISGPTPVISVIVPQTTSSLLVNGGQKGDSAYTVAVKNGFVGSEQDWLDSLQGTGGSSGGVNSVNGHAGTVVLDQDDILDGTTFKQYSQTEKTKLAGIATGATANSSDATLLARANHTGTQLSSTISDFNTAVDARISNVVAGAPTLLDTLDEIAAALGDDPNFATTMTNALALKAPLANPTFTGTVSGITAGMVGLGNVNNTSDANKPVSTAQQAALDLKANLASPTFTGTVSGITAAMVGLGNVDNTSDATKNSAVVTVSNHIFNNTNTIRVLDSLLTIQDDGDATKQFKFQVSGITTGTTRTWTIQDSSDTFVGRATTDTLTNKTLTSPVINSPTGLVKADVGLSAVPNVDATDRANHTGTQLASTVSDFSEAVDDRVAALLVQGSNITLNYNDAANTLTISASVTGGGGGDMAAAVYDPAGIAQQVLGTTASQTMTNKTIGNTNTITAKDTLFTLQDDGDTTKQLRFQLSSITTATTRTLTVPDVSDTIVVLGAAQTLTNKTLTSPVINTPTGIVKGDVGLGSVDNTSDATKNAAAVTLTNKTVDNTNTISLKDTLFTLQDDGDTTKQLRFQLSSITTSTTRTLTVPDASDTLVLLGVAQTLTNKTLTSPVINTPTGIVKGDVGLGNVDNTSDATKNAAAVTLTNKTLGAFTISDANDVTLGTTTGTKFGTSTSQKIGFYNAAPVIQSVATTDLGTVLSNLGLRAAGTAYPITTSGAVSMTGAVTTGLLTTAGTISATTAISTGTTLTTAQDKVLANATSAPFTVTLPTAVGVTGRMYYIEKIDSSANAVTVACNGAQTIDGSTTQVISIQNGSVWVISDGSNWTQVAAGWQHRHAGTDITSGTIDINRIPTGTSGTTVAFGNHTHTGVYEPAFSTLSSKTIDNSNTVNLKDTLFTLQDDGDTTKQARFQLSGITTATTRTYTLPDTSDTLVTLAATQTLTGKTLTSPVINTPTGIVKGDVGLGNVDNTSDATKNSASVTLTNKTLSAFTITDANDVTLGTTTGTKIGTATTQKLGFFNATPVVQPGATTDLGTVLSNLGLRASGTAYPITTSGAVAFTGAVSVIDNQWSMKDNADNTKVMQLDLTAITTATTRTLTVPDVSDTLVTLAATQTLTNKSIVATQLTGNIDSARLSKTVTSDPAVAGYGYGVIHVNYTTSGTSSTIMEVWYDTGSPSLASFWLNENGAPRAAMPKASDVGLKVVGWGTSQTGHSFMIETRASAGTGARSSQWGINASGKPVIGANEIAAENVIVVAAAGSVPSGTPTGTVVVKLR